MTFGAWLREKVALVTDQPTSRPIPLADSPFLLLDIDITGLDVRRDCARGVATLPLENGVFRICDIQYVRLSATKFNRMKPSPDWQERYDALVETVTGRVVVTYNVRFVMHMISRTDSLKRLAQARCRWTDLRDLLTGIFGTDMGQVSSMKLWQQRLNIEPATEHSAVGDIVNMAQMLQIVLAYCDESNTLTLDQLIESKKNHDWLRGE